MTKMVKFETAKDVADDAEVLAVIMEGLVETTARARPSAEMIVRSAEWFHEVLLHVKDAVPDAVIPETGDGCDISSQSLITLLVCSMDELHNIVDKARTFDGATTDELREAAARAYIAAALAVCAALDAPSYQPERIAELRTIVAARRQEDGGGRPPTLSMLN